MDEKEYAWSLDGENYDHGIFDTIEEAIEEAKFHNWDADDEDRVKYAFIAEVENTEFKGWKVDSDDTIEKMQQNAYDEHENAESWLEDITKEQTAELTDKINEVIQNWLVKHALQFFYYDLVNTKKYDLEKETFVGE